MMKYNAEAQKLTGYLSIRRLCVLEDPRTTIEDDEDKSLICKLSPEKILAGVKSFVGVSMGGGNTGWSSFRASGDIGV